MDWSNLLKRVFTALIAGSGVIFLIVHSYTGLWIVAFFIAIFSIAEILLLIRQKILNVTSFYTFVVVAVLLLMNFPKFQNHHLLMKIASAVLLVYFPLLITLNLMDKSIFEKLSMNVLGIIWVTPSVFLWVKMSETAANYDYRIPLGMLFLCWVADTAAFFAGKLLGKNKLLESVSPNKTWEGLAGAVLANLILGYFLDVYWSQSFSWTLLAFVSVFTGLLGDLAESLLKRNLNVKDSSGLLPGHGGFLDRFDGFYFVIPINYVIIQFYT